MTREPQPHRTTSDQHVVDISALELNQAKQAAHKAYLASQRVLDLLDETADPSWIVHAEAARDHAWKLYEALVLKTKIGGH
ncbi:MAG TPA: hypothetical protein VLE97_11115 [Gaiellaceae bacterium]|nr:hypothetical protein [Gaiellaceae bacterium]